MKISRNIIVISCFVAVFIIQLIYAAVRGTLFKPSLPIFIVIAVFFAGLFALLTYCIFTLVVPRVRTAKRDQENQRRVTTVTTPPPTEALPKRSPRSELPVRDRISAYVAERRREEGISAPPLLRPPKTTHVAAQAAAAQAASNITQSVNSTEGLPGIDRDLDFDNMGQESMADDDFGFGDSFYSDEENSEDSGFERSNDSSDESLPGIDGDFDLGSDDLANNFDDLDDTLDDSFETSEEDELTGTNDSDNELGSFDESSDESEFDVFDKDLDDPFEASGGNDEMGSLDSSEVDDYDEDLDDPFEASGGDEFTGMDDAGVDDSMSDDSMPDDSMPDDISMESGGDLSDFDEDFDLSMNDEDLTLADDDFGNIEEIGDLEP